MIPYIVDSTMKSLQSNRLIQTEWKRIRRNFTSIGFQSEKPIILILNKSQFISMTINQLILVLNHTKNVKNISKFINPTFNS